MPDLVQTCAGWLSRPVPAIVEPNLLTENNVLPDPIHPAIVHLPIALTLLLPLVIGGAYLIARRGFPIRTAWVGVVIGAALLVGSAWLATETGEQQEERVEPIVSESALETHEARASLFLGLATGTLALCLVGLAKERLGKYGRIAATGASLALLPAGWLVGHTGGELVYRHGAAQAYVGDSRGAELRKDSHEDTEGDEER
jgi:uncharacterized membrane protein